MKWKRRDGRSLMSGTVVRYSLDTDDYSGEINATRDGVGILGGWPLLDKQSEIDEFKWFLDLARAQSVLLVTSGNRPRTIPVDDEIIRLSLGSPTAVLRLVEPSSR